MNVTLERIYKQAYLQFLSQHLPGGLKKTIKSLNQDSISLGQDLNARISKVAKFLSNLTDVSNLIFTLLKYFDF
jgi:ABC-type transporter Mla subunit MlaD